MLGIFQKIKPETWLLIKIILLFLGVWLFFLLRPKGNWALIIMPFLVILSYNLYSMMKKAQDELKDFSESIRYRDFSRNFNISQAPTEVKTLRQGFNEINSTLRIISKERETQFLYLQQILELVDIGILSYELETGKQNWMNQTFKKMFGIPYLKTIQSLKLRDEKMFQVIDEIRPGQTQVVTIHSENRSFKVLVVASIFQTEGITHKLLAFQNVNLALDENEAQAWQRLLSVMTHEIMNSVAPISSLAGTLKNRIETAQKNLKPDDLEDLGLGLETIERRSEGLLKFAQSYRNLNKTLVANLQLVAIRDVFENLFTLLQPTMDQKGISLEIVLKDPKLKAEIDVELIEQVLINLLANASDAVKDKPEKRISLMADTEHGKLFIRVTDNGTGIPPELLDRIFIPFFSTKKTGSGIGLSLCKQIMLLHRGNIQVYSEPEKGSAFELVFG
jgi:two-component system nitrogen regulation sensor histidine kinase NtrY